MHDPVSHPPVIRATDSVAPSLLRASVAQRLGIAIALSAALWLAVFWAFDQAGP
jgi:hypothetical protein